MLKIKEVKHVYLNSNILKALSQNRISTILEFLEEDVEKISALTKLSFPEVLAVRNDIIKKYSAPLINGNELLLKSLSMKKFISTGLPSLDAVLGGGILLGFLTEVCGLAESGKSQLCFQLAINSAKYNEHSVLYIDTKGDFSAVRIQKILDSYKCSYKEMAIIMCRIRVVYIWNMEDVIELLQKIKNKTIVIENLSLIILDSLPCLMFQYIGDETKVGLRLLNIFVNNARSLASELSIGVICINIQTRWVDQDVDVEDAPQSTSIYNEKRNRCLGNYWQHIPAVVLLLEKPLDSSLSEKSGTYRISVTLLKSNCITCMQKCTLKLSSLGVTK